MDVNVNEFTQLIVDLFTTWGLKVAGVGIALFVSWIIAGTAKRGVTRSLEGRLDVTLVRFFANLARYAILTGAVLSCLGVFGIETTSFAAVIGAAGLAVGLAFQGTLSAFSAGVLLLVFRPFRVGDMVQVSGVTGTVRELELFTTQLLTPDHRVITVPNSEIFGAIIENFSHQEKRRVDVAVGCDYGADIDKTREVLEAMVGGIEGVVEDPAPQIFLRGLGDSAVDWEVRVWCETADYWAVHQATVRATKYALDGAGIGIPFPQMDVHLDKVA